METKQREYTYPRLRIGLLAFLFILLIIGAILQNFYITGAVTGLALLLFLKNTHDFLRRTR